MPSYDKEDLPSGFARGLVALMPVRVKVNIDSLTLIVFPLSRQSFSNLYVDVQGIYAS
ncbi:hypothetical protein GCM10022410_18560 [Amphibacillus indicireducens]|uniref:Transposase n=1 Tax=Amphibacillus indicireducens TaxID=1076330 RepID=A0ABP7VSF8_9BACI